MKYRIPLKKKKTAIDMLPVDGRPMVGERYHISWASHTTTAVCVEVFDDIQKVQLYTMRCTPYKTLTSFNELRKVNNNKPHVLKKIREKFPLKGV